MGDKRYWPLALFLTAGLALGGCGEAWLPRGRRTPREDIAAYARALEAKLLAQYRNHPEFGREVARVDLDVVDDIETDVTGRMRRVTFAQLVYDRWGERMPELEGEYFVVTFAPAGVQAARRAPEITVGLNTQGTYSELPAGAAAKKAAPAAREAPAREPAPAAPAPPAPLPREPEAEETREADAPAPAPLPPVSRAPAPRREPEDAHIHGQNAPAALPPLTEVSAPRHAPRPAQRGEQARAPAPPDPVGPLPSLDGPTDDPQAEAVEPLPALEDLSDEQDASPAAEAWAGLHRSARAEPVEIPVALAQDPVYE